MFYALLLPLLTATPPAPAVVSGHDDPAIRVSVSESRFFLG